MKLRMPNNKRNRKQNEIIVIAGPSSSGKSTFLKTNDYINCSPEHKTVFAYDIEVCLPNVDTYIVHYNTLRVVDKAYPDNANGSVSEYGASLVTPDFSKDKAWKVLKDQKQRLRVITIVALEKEIWERVRTRKCIEKERDTNNQYPTDRWIGHFLKIDLEKHYRAWLSELSKCEIPIELVKFRDGQYKKIQDVESSLREINMTPDEEKEVIGEFFSESPAKSKYQRVECPQSGGLEGQDRSSSVNLVLNNMRAGESVLDVGCAQGLFCFEAERRGASVVHGVDIKLERFETARLLARLQQSRAEFYLRDVSEWPITQRYDVVLLLNVIHHLHFPLKVLYDLSQITNRILIVEFPGMTDPKYCDTVQSDSGSGDGMPLIGVSLLDEKDQTFVFSPEAIRRVLVRHIYGFKSVEIMQSPMKNRYIAVCKKYL